MPFRLVTYVPDGVLFQNRVTRKPMKKLLILFLLLMGTAPLTGKVKLPALIGSHMVLQRDTLAGIWGETAPDAASASVLLGAVNASARPPTRQAAGPCTSRRRVREVRTAS